MSTTGCARRDERRLAAERLERAHRLVRALGDAPLALEHERAHRLVDRREVPVQQLLQLVRLGRNVRALAQLQHRLLRRRPVAARAGDEDLVLRRRRDLEPERLLDARPGARRCRSPFSAAIAATAHV